MVALKYVPGTVPETKMQEVGLIWLIAMATGMRSGEIVNRPVSEVFLKKQYVLLPDTKTARLESSAGQFCAALVVFGLKD